ncbi:GntR family transcriptional regulator [Ammoniphilus sp. CFH 90114]|uniref:GntR family transcriptional regulator n=1 Tax=Ammoniphilus sp. CFH 90114 TaxID=2493665 RepID=UPI00100EEDCD|nr:GntR family transcriptional regulator [Ammoniphilus sp. CFH 90114]RXT03727.1 GntR family transcriptional regulator [Ammoniphilus sp. CFH 90114]
MNDYGIEKKAPYYEQFYHSIKRMIYEGKYKPGERINETQLAKEFGVSKSPIREAIRVLEKEGLIVVDEKSRVMVYEPTLRDVEEIYVCRMALESFAVGLATTIATDLELQTIERTLQDTEQAIKERKEDREIILLNAQFHDLIVNCTQNRRLKRQLDDLKSLKYLFRILNFQGENRAETILSQHREIFDFIKNREAEKASKQMIEHLQCDLDYLLQVLSNHDQ